MNITASQWAINVQHSFQFFYLLISDFSRCLWSTDPSDAVPYFSWVKATVCSCSGVCSLREHWGSLILTRPSSLTHCSPQTPRHPAAQSPTCMILQLAYCPEIKKGIKKGSKALCYNKERLGWLFKLSGFKITTFTNTNHRYFI